MPDQFEDHCWKDIVSAEILEIYRPYRRETYIGQRPALLAIDLYNLAFEGGSKPVSEVVKEFPSACGVHAWDAIKPIQELFAAARSLTLPVIYTTTETRREANSVNVSATNRQSKKIDPRAYQIYEAFRPEPGDLVVYKERASGFFGTPLIAHLTKLGVDSLIVCGESTSGCVRASVVDAYSNGFHTVVVEECVFDRSILSHKVCLFDLHHKYADVMHLDEVKNHLRAVPVRHAL
ncbi:MAG TPA: isochorismatase family protein [Candidatus Binatia bacterium]|jgi:nicotinamidase-related amidase